jgi:transposase-like protein
MNVHKNARLTPRSRAGLVRRVLVEGQSAKAVAMAFGVDAKTVAKGPWRREARSFSSQGFLASLVSWWSN